MNIKIIKKVISVIACVSVIAGIASISNAYSINSGSSKFLKTRHNVSSGSYGYSYKVSYVLFDGLATGAYAPGLVLKAKMSGGPSVTICSINTSQKSGNYSIPVSGDYDFSLYNGSSKHVAITFDYLNY